MIIGILSDTHYDKMNALPHIIEEFKKRKVEIIVHCGDINPEHLDSKLFGDFPVICALVEEQTYMPKFAWPPKGWIFTKPGDRVCYLPDGTRIYVGHKRSFEFLTGAEKKLFQTMDRIRRDYDNVRVMFSGHTHHQIFAQTGIVNFINPGAVEHSFDGYEFAIYDTETNDVTFSRIPLTEPEQSSFSVGIISDSLNISKLEPEFWNKLKEEFEKKQVSHIIHCGNLAVNDIGIEELAGFPVNFYLRPDQPVPKKLPNNWQLIPRGNPIVEINDYRFYVQLDLGAELSKQSEMQMHDLCQKLRRKYSEINFVLCGFTNDAFLEEGQQVRIVNPGDVVKDRNFAVITLPVTEIFFGHVAVEPLAPLTS